MPEDKPSPISRLSSPLGLRDQIQRPERRLDLVPFLDLAFIALLFGLLSSPLIFTPGLALRLPTAEPVHLDHLAASRVLTIDGANLLYEGGIYQIKDLPAAFARDLIDGDEVLLIKAEQDFSMQTFAKIAEAADAAGFAEVLLAARAEAAPSPDALSTPSGF